MSKDKIQVKYNLLSEDAKLPQKSNPYSVGFDIFCIEDLEIRPHKTKKINTDLCIVSPPGTYVRIVDRCSVAFNLNLHVFAGVIDNNCSRAIQVLLHNFGNTTIFILKGHRIAQLIFEKNETNVEFIKENNFENTICGRSFASTRD